MAGGRADRSGVALGPLRRDLPADPGRAIRAAACQASAGVASSAPATSGLTGRSLRRIVGWMMTGSLRTELVLAALEMAVHHRDTGLFAVQPMDEPGVIHLPVDRPLSGDHCSVRAPERLATVGTTTRSGRTSRAFLPAAESWARRSAPLAIH